MEATTGNGCRLDDEEVSEVDEVDYARWQSSGWRWRRKATVVVRGEKAKAGEEEVTLKVINIGTLKDMRVEGEYVTRRHGAESQG